MVGHGVESAQVILDESSRVHNQIFCLDRHPEIVSARKKMIIFCLRVQCLNQVLRIFLLHYSLGETEPL